MQCFILDLINDDPDYIETKIEEMTAFFKARSIDFSWTTGPSTRPAELGQMLEAHGFVYSDSTTGMAIDLLALNENVFTNANLAIIEIEDLETLKILRSIEISGFGTSESAAQNYYDSYAYSGFGDGTSLAPLYWVAAWRTCRHCFSTLTCRRGRYLWCCNYSPEQTSGSSCCYDAACTARSTQTGLSYCSPLAH